MSASEYSELYKKYKAAQDELSDCTAKLDRMFIALVDAGGKITELEAQLLNRDEQIAELKERLEIAYRKNAELTHERN